MVQFQVAGVSARVEFAAAPRLAANLLPWQVPECGSAPDLTLQVLLDSAPPNAPLLPPSGGHVNMSVVRQPDGFWFQRLAGLMHASADFSCCRAWTPAGSPLQEEAFHGRPWLMLALWGHLSCRGGALLHGAVCALGGRYFLLLGDQQVGKSTLAHLVVQAGGSCLTDEYPALTWHDDAPWTHGVPWPGMTGPPIPLSGLLAAAFFVRPAPDNLVQRLSLFQAGSRLLSNTRFFVWNSSTIPPVLELLNFTTRAVPVYEFGFVPAPSAVEALREAL